MVTDVALDHEIALKYVRFLLDRGLDDSHDARRQFSEEQGVHPKLLYANPHIRDVARLFTHRSNFERLADMTLREWMLYHYYFVHQGYRYGAESLQQQWLGHDIIKSPIDCWIYQEIIHKVRPDVILELGVMFGGASHFFANLCDLLGHGVVIGIDLSLEKVRRVDNPRISYFEGSSTAPETLTRVRPHLAGKRVLVIADSDHERGHVLDELRIYSEFVPVGSYYVVEDTLNDVMGWHPVPNEGPLAAVRDFLRENDAFVPDTRFAEKYILSLTPHGHLLRVK